IPATDFIEEDQACPTTKALAIYSAWEVGFEETSIADFTPDFSGARDTLWVSQCHESTYVVYVYRQLSDGTVQGCEAYALLGIAIGSGLCLPYAGIPSGLVRTPADEPVTNVQVRLSATEGVVHEHYTGTTGQYSVGRVGVPGPHTLTAARADSVANGVTTLDLAIITRHILGVDPITNPYYLLAADVNQSGTVSILDLIQIRRVILGITTRFPASPSWRFVPADYVFPNLENPWQEPFPEEINFDADEVPNIPTNFIGIKMGDVNDSASSN
ncbi:MAG: dockerin type I domain-containing protein, partial [Bacteroidota bacterium]